MFSCFMFFPYVECLAVCSKLGLCLYIYIWCLLEDFHVIVSKKTSECLPLFEDCVAAGQLPWCSDCCPVCKGNAQVPHCCECLLVAPRTCLSLACGPDVEVDVKAESGTLLLLLWEESASLVVPLRPSQSCSRFLLHWKGNGILTRGPVVIQPG